MKHSNSTPKDKPENYAIGRLLLIPMQPCLTRFMPFQEAVELT